ncbi:hypothetical protein EDC01DRAFT_165596 [Geopyxis carbonaria]|nr:hypothetical protein EDC01DRAFT_165596 [Geopyxis carbonaria]
MCKTFNQEPTNFSWRMARLPFFLLVLSTSLPQCHCLLVLVSDDEAPCAVVQADVSSVSSTLVLEGIEPQMPIHLVITLDDIRIPLWNQYWLEYVGNSGQGFSW